MSRCWVRRLEKGRMSGIGTKRTERKQSTDQVSSDRGSSWGEWSWLYWNFSLKWCGILLITLPTHLRSSGKEVEKADDLIECWVFLKMYKKNRMAKNLRETNWVGKNEKERVGGGLMLYLPISFAAKTWHMGKFDSRRCKTETLCGIFGKTLSKGGAVLFFLSSSILLLLLEIYMWWLECSESSWTWRQSP